MKLKLTSPRPNLPGEVKFWWHILTCLLWVTTGGGGGRESARASIVTHFDCDFDPGVIWASALLTPVSRVNLRTSINSNYKCQLTRRERGVAIGFGWVTTTGGLILSPRLRGDFDAVFIITKKMLREKKLIGRHSHYFDCNRKPVIKVM